MDCRTFTEAVFLPPKSLRTTEVSDYQEEMVITLSSARALALKSNQKSQQKYKKQYNERASIPKFCVGDWILVYFPHCDKIKLEIISAMAWSM